MREFYSLSLTICYCMITSEENPDQEILKRLDYIKNNTHEKILLPLTTSELIILTNFGRGIGRPIEFTDNDGVVREYSLHQLIRYAKESYFELSQFVVKIGKKYSLDIPMRGQQEVFQIPTAPDLIAIEGTQTSVQPSSQPSVQPPAQPPIQPSQLPVPPSVQPSSLPVPPSVQPAESPADEPPKPSDKPAKSSSE